MSSTAVRTRILRVQRQGRSAVGGAGAIRVVRRTGSHKGSDLQPRRDCARRGLGTDEYELLRPAQKAHGAGLLFHDVVEVREVVRREVEYLLALVGEPCHEAGSVAGVLLEVLGQPPEQLRKDDGITLEGRLVADRDA